MSKKPQETMGCEWIKAKKEAAEGSTTHRVKSRETKRNAEERLDRPLVSINEMNFTFNFNISNIGMPAVEPAPALPPNARKVKAGTKEARHGGRGLSRKASALPTWKREQMPHGGPTARTRNHYPLKAKESKAKAEPKMKPEPKGEH